MRQAGAAWQLLREAAAAWQSDQVSSMGAALSYYAAFSLAPLLLIVISLAGLLFGRDAAEGEVVAAVGGLAGAGGEDAVRGLLSHAGDFGSNALGFLVGVVTLLIGATSVFAELQSDMDRVWRAPPARGSGLFTLVRARVLSFGVVLALAFLLLVSLAINAALAAFGRWWGGWLGAEAVVLAIANFAVSLAVTTALFAVIYKLLPRVRVAWHDVWIGALFTALLFALGKAAIGAYLGRSGIANGFGAAGSLVVIMVWVYYSAQLFLFGAEFTRVYAERHGSRRGASALTRPA
ncbi:MAG: YihY/virulence factor BrkB family protein [Gammaproteobacteria bacterium]|nr:YihY/virulence factor BrkB family protein [Gammaproteobacteria bacterium]MBI5616567.1 YihY/virulence factor BrkB family protein [Gammaproteobacteria bacterium]